MAIATRPPCTHCKAIPVVKRLATPLSGTKAVDIALCRCDYLTCVHCKATVYDRYAHRCAACGKDPGSKQ